MAAITLEGIPDKLKEQLEAIAKRERRSLNQQAILLLGRAGAEEPIGFEQAYSRFHKSHGNSPLEDGDLEGLRAEEEERSVNL